MSRLKMSAPAIYHFAGSTWGWSRLVDLLEVVNQIRTEKKLAIFNACQLYLHFRALPINKGYTGDLPWVDEDTVLEMRTYQIETDLSMRKDRLEHLFIPAGWSTRVIQLVKQGVRCVQVITESSLFSSQTRTINFLDDAGKIIRVK